MPETQLPLLSPDEFAVWERSLCFTGHRPDKLPKDEMLDALLAAMNFHISRIVNTAGFDRFYIGLADGIDYYAARQLFSLRDAGKPLHIIGVQPCEDYREVYRFFRHDMRHFDEMLRQCDEITVLPGRRFDKGIFLERNRYMVQHSAAILAVCDEEGRSGSRQALSYAKQLGLAWCHLPVTVFGPPYPAPQDWPAERYGI